MSAVTALWSLLGSEVGVTRGDAHFTAALVPFSNATVLCRYLGEWYVPPKDQDDKEHLTTFAQQQSTASTSCWTVAAIYAALAVISGVGMCYHAMKAKRS